MERLKNQPLSDFVKSLVAAEGKPLYEAAAFINVTPQSLSRKLLESNLKYEEAERIAEGLGYKIVWLRKEGRE